MALKPLSVLAFALALTSTHADSSSYQDNSICACDQMMRSYGTSNAGLWGKDDWWQSGIALTLLADISSLDSSYNGTHFDTFATTYSEAPGYGGYTGFIDDYCDDEGWWAMGWLAAYDLTQNPDYLNLAISIYNDISNNKASCGGIIWEKGGNYLASIANELYIASAAGIANRVSADQKESYLDSATAIWDWLFSIGVSVRRPSGPTTRGVILSAAVELYRATGNSTYLDTARKIADAVTTTGSTFTGSNGVLTDCSNGCDDTSAIFKAALFRGLRQLQDATPQDTWKTWLTTNAQSTWSNDLSITTANGDTECQLGANLNGPVGNVTFVTQAAGLASLIAAWAVSS
ncbi:hypothetical protein N7468_010433 [Penicillium chermesinum]|uniref:Mannan endo-1,6-alpha-mannosidase n=1 Tax=Penicillium chermesinum TaxID=63820 RepID=A0A9W9NCN5_9EURO|nr:uncharacterized protein N7468_010433 [Penicillium chermesinum]KAJ5217425.1 hypothetical protein N7468_010433 [Penicillium chermesinum]KAJ6170965.1 hypothetical protein N7470_000032 [Penicillium chermesinum]